MVLFLVLFYAQLSLSELSLGSMDNFYNITEIYSIMQNMTVFYPGLFSMPIGGLFNDLVLNNVTNFGYKKPITFILGGLYAGNPMSALQVLYIADKIAGEYSKAFVDNEFKQMIDNSIIHFIPVPNSKAYQKMEDLYSSSGTFTTIRTGLDLNINCTNNTYPGINPDRNFDFEWTATADDCSEYNSGANTFESSISSSLKDFIVLSSDYEVSVMVISFQESGEYIFYPYAYDNRTFNGTKDKFYDILKKNTPDSYKFDSYCELAQCNVGGTLLDYASSQGLFSFQIALETTDSYTSENIFNKADSLYAFTLSALNLLYPELDIEEDSVSVEEDECTLSSCSYYSSVSFTIPIDNKGALDEDLNFIIYYKFNDPGNYNFISATLEVEVDDASDTETTLECVAGSTIACNATISAFSSNDLIFNFSRLSEESSKDFELNVSFSSQSTGIYLNSSFVSILGNIDDYINSDDNGGDGDGRRRDDGIKVGAILLIILLILLLITGVVLCCRRKKLEEVRNPEPQRA